MVAMWTGLWYASAAWLRNRPSPWPPSSVPAENSPHWFACCISSTVNAVFSCVVCLPAVWMLLRAPHQVQFISTSRVGLCIGDPHEHNWDMAYAGDWGQLLTAVALTGQSFAIRTAVDLLLQAKHGLLTIDGAVHHVIFIAAGWLIRRHCMMPLNAAVLMSMELSTPFLNYYVFFRTRYPYAPDVTTSRTLFCYTFVAARVLLNSAGAALFLQQYPETLPN